MKEKEQPVDRTPATYLLTWDPTRYAFSNFEKQSRRTAKGRVARFKWNVGDAEVVVGDRVFLMRHGEDRPGLVGSGTIKSVARDGSHWDPTKPNGSITRYADVTWEVLREHPLVPLPELSSRTDERELWTAHGSGFRIPSNLALRVEVVWEEMQLQQKGLEAEFQAPSASSQTVTPPGDDDGLPVPDETRPLVYVSYNTEDGEWKDRILEFLSPYEEEGGFKVWHDRLLETGEEFEPKLQEVRETAIVAIVVLSQHWLNSKYIQTNEWPLLLERAQSDLRLLPIIVTKCDWQGSEIRDFNLFPPQARPVSAGNVDADLTEFAKIVASAVADILGEQPERRFDKQDLAPSPDDVRIEPEPISVKPPTWLTPDLRTASELSSYRSDVAATKDRLGVLSDVENLCQVIMAKQWKPPLSIGLFGDWGSGKTSFINLMRGMIAATADRGNAEASAFVSNIIQIEFNAWHYMDANLWANLVVRILDGIYSTVFERDRRDEKGDEFKQIVAHLQMLHEEVEKSEEQRRQLESAVGQIDLQIETKRGEQDTAVGMIATLKAAVSDSDNAIAKEFAEIKKSVIAAVDNLGLNEEASLSEAQSQAQKLMQTGARIVSAWNSMSKNKLWWLALPLAVLVFCFWVIQDFSWLAESPNVQRAVTSVTTFIALFVSWTKSLAPHLKKIKTGLDAVEAASSKVENVRRGWLEARHKELTELENKRTAAVSDISTLETRKSEVQREQKQLEERLDQLMQGRGLEEFLLSRAGSADYQEQLGIIALVHQDMKELQRKLLAGLKVSAEGKIETRHYDRVILYIDDLDRCTPERVVEVLQAVHLLLSIPLFVVVVAADPRWLLQCLLTHYQDLIHKDINVDDFEWAVTPQNYLEKIFQIPYTLPPMASRDFPKYVTDLFSKEDVTPDADETEIHYRELQNEVEYLEIKTRSLQQHAPARQVPDEKIETTPAKVEAKSAIPQAKGTEWQKEQKRLNEARKKLRTAGRELKTKKQQALVSLPTFDANPKTLKVSGDEQDFVKQLLPLLTTPRTTKRLLNVYRLIRVSLNQDEIDAFEREEHQAVLVLLAVMYSYPAIAVEFFTGLRKTNVNTIREYIQHKNHNNDNGNWHRLARGIDKVPCVQDIDVYRRWLDVVGRFSFQVGHELTRDQS